MSPVRTAASVVTVLAVVLSLAACSSELRPPELPDYSAAELEAQTAADNQRALDDLLRDFPDAEVPDVERVRLVSLEEWPLAMAECLSAEGFGAVAEGGGLSASAPFGQELPYAIAYYVCSVEYPIDPRVMVPLVEDQIRYLYDYYTQVMTPCLEAEGYEVPEPPSRQTFVSTYGQPGSWAPYTFVTEAVSSQEEWDRVNRLCTQTPAELFGG
ncbi:MAG: hypothetical protein K2X36_02115 [Microbacteriaceae bacterium]|nr:hypothetical protein [Microbacteriaceae bacterium]